MTHDSMRQALIDARNQGIPVPEFTRIAGLGDLSTWHHSDCAVAGQRRVVQVEQISDKDWWHGECPKCRAPDPGPSHDSDALEMVRMATHYGNEVHDLAARLSVFNLHTDNQSYGDEYYFTLNEWREFCSDYRELPEHHGLSDLQRTTMMPLVEDSTPLAHYAHRLAADVTEAARELIARTPVRAYVTRLMSEPASPMLYAAKALSPLNKPDRNRHAHTEDTTLLAEAKQLVRHRDHVLVEWDARLSTWTDPVGLAPVGDYTPSELQAALEVFINGDRQVTLQEAIDAVRVASTA